MALGCHFFVRSDHGWNVLHVLNLLQSKEPRVLLFLCIVSEKLKNWNWNWKLVECDKVHDIRGEGSERTLLVMMVAVVKNHTPSVLDALFLVTTETVKTSGIHQTEGAWEALIWPLCPEVNARGQDSDRQLNVKVCSLLTLFFHRSPRDLEIDWDPPSLRML